MNRGQVAVLIVLVVVVLVYTGAIVVGRGQGGGDSRQGPQQALGNLLVRPASLDDLAPTPRDCVQGKLLVVPRVRGCAYALRSGFFGKRLRLRLAAPGEATAVLTQPKPEVTDTKRLDAGAAEAELTYRQDGSRLTVACTAAPGPACRLEVAG